MDSIELWSGRYEVPETTHKNPKKEVGFVCDRRPMSPIFLFQTPYLGAERLMHSVPKT